MSPIDKRLYSLGYTIQEKDDTSYTYVRNGKNVLDEYSHVVKLVLPKRTPILQSYLIGESCSWGQHCAMPLTLRELRLFSIKMRFMRIRQIFRRLGGNK